MCLSWKGQQNGKEKQVIFQKCNGVNIKQVCSSFWVAFKFCFNETDFSFLSAFLFFEAVS